MLNEDILGYMLSHAHNQPDQPRIVNVKPDISEDEVMDIFNEVINVFKEHNISYKCATRIVLALTECFMTGAIELYNIENGIPTNRSEHL